MIMKPRPPALHFKEIRDLPLPSSVYLTLP